MMVEEHLCLLFFSEQCEHVKKQSRLFHWCQNKHIKYPPPTELEVVLHNTCGHDQKQQLLQQTEI